MQGNHSLSLSDRLIKICLHYFLGFDTICTYVFQLRFDELACNLFSYSNLIYLGKVLISFRFLVDERHEQNKSF